MAAELSSMLKHGATMILKKEIKYYIEGPKKYTKEYFLDSFAILQITSLPEYVGITTCNIYIAVKKHDHFKDWILTMNFSCGNSKANNINTSENWSQEICIHTSEPQRVVTVNIEVTFISIQPIVNIKLHEDETLTDFQLSAEDGSVAVHRAYLATHSDVFKTMLHGQWKETAEGRVAVKGVTRQTLQHFKDYIYLGTLPDDGLCPLLLLATRYLMDPLKIECMVKIIQTITAENLDTYLDFVVENEMHELKDNIFGKIPGSIFVEACAIKMKALMCNKTDHEE